MLGDLIETIKTFWLQNIKCTHHNYTSRVIDIGRQRFETRECTKCGRVKVIEL